MKIMKNRELLGLTRKPNCIPSTVTHAKPFNIFNSVLCNFNFFHSESKIIIFFFFYPFISFPRIPYHNMAYLQSKQHAVNVFMYV